MPPDDWIDDVLRTAMSKQSLSDYKSSVMANARICKEMGWTAQETYLMFQAMSTPDRFSHLPLVGYWIGLAYKEGK